MTAIAKDKIAERAYTLWETEGRPDGRDLDFWLRAEAELSAFAAELTAAPASEAAASARPGRKDRAAAADSARPARATQKAVSRRARR